MQLGNVGASGGNLEFWDLTRSPWLAWDLVLGHQSQVSQGAKVSTRHSDSGGC